AELGNAVGDELLKVHVSYWPLVRALLKKFNPRTIAAPRESAGGSFGKERTSDSPLQVIKGLAHITGGGFVDNIPRVLPKNCDVVIRKGSWDMLPIFQLIRAKSGVPEEELYQVFNMGIGMTVIVAADEAHAVLRFIRAREHMPWMIGEVVKGKGMTRLVG